MSANRRKLAETLYLDITIRGAECWDIIRAGLSRDMEVLGLRGNDLAENIGWSPSKTSKILSGKQNPSPDDIRLCTRAIGCTPDKFVLAGADPRDYKLDNYIRPLSEVFDAYMEEDVSSFVKKGIAEFELPLSILSALGVKISDYAVRTGQTDTAIDAFSVEMQKSGAVYIRFWQRATKERDEITPEFGVWIKPDEGLVLFAVYLNRNGSDSPIQTRRMDYKGFLQISDSETEDFDFFAEQHNDWIPRMLAQGEIYSEYDYIQEYLNSEKFNDIIVDIFRKYCDLVWEAKQADILPDIYKITERRPLTTEEIVRIFTNSLDFNPDVKEVAIRREKYCCEIDPEHESFDTDSGHKYVDIVPLIPFGFLKKQDTSLLTAANAVCLCPKCSSQLKNGKKSDREEMLIRLFKKHEGALKENGVEFRLSELLNAYEL